MLTVIKQISKDQKQCAKFHFNILMQEQTASLLLVFYWLCSMEPTDLCYVFIAREAACLVIPVFAPGWSATVGFFSFCSKSDCGCPLSRNISRFLLSTHLCGLLLNPLPLLHLGWLLLIVKAIYPLCLSFSHGFKVSIEGLQISTVVGLDFRHKWSEAHPVPAGKASYYNTSCSRVLTCMFDSVL